MAKKIIITGATGLIGSKLTNKLISKNYEVVVFTRNAKKGNIQVPSAHKYVEWDYLKPAKWQAVLEDSYAVIHLSGASIAGKRFTESYKKKVKSSRIISTQNLVKAISAAINKPKVFVCASGINYYGDSNDKILTEDSPGGNDFLAEVCGEWEYEASKAENFGVRRVSIRTSPVLSLQDGMLKSLKPLFKSYLGASLGSGKQWFSWIHVDDIINIYLLALEDETVQGAVNASSPAPVKMHEFAEQFGKALNRPAFFKVPRFVLKTIMGEAADFITASLRVIPERLQKSGFIFRFPEIYSALDDIVRNKK
ncbi:MAG TPA: TIGR01777 family oxidoreductase [Ignavibacteriaceae bacterium]|nr:TIGR01777 family oxidoreductase [Ignavibacteriaceae bacterium]